MLFSIRKKIIAPLSVIFVLAIQAEVYSQDALSLDDLSSESTPIKEAFNGPLLIYGQSTNMLQAKRLDLVFGHRFGKLNEGAFNAWGLDQSFVRIGFEYGVKDWLTVGVGRSSLGKNFDLYVKHRPLVQTRGEGKNIPVTLSAFFSSAFSSNELRRQNKINDGGQFVNQLVYTFQTLISRQFSTRFAAQLSGSIVHRNTVVSNLYDNDIYGIGGGMRFKLTNRMHFVAEYTHMLERPQGLYNPAAVGIDIVAGGHVFNVHVANSAGIIEKEFLTATTDKFSEGLRLGFTIRRSFMLAPKVEGGKTKY